MHKPYCPCSECNFIRGLIPIKKVSMKAYITLYKARTGEVFAVGICCNGENHITGDIREHRDGKDTFTIAVSRSTIEGPKNLIQQCVSDDDLCVKDELHCDVTFQDIVPYGISHMEYRHPEIAKLTYMI